VSIRGLLDDLDCFGSTWDAELVVDRRASPPHPVAARLQGKTRQSPVLEPAQQRGLPARKTCRRFERGVGRQAWAQTDACLTRARTPAQSEVELSANLRTKEASAFLADADRSRAAYRHRTISNQPKPAHKKKPRKTVSLTPAEARVLAFLTTYRTLSAIGDQLGIGRPTVKTHAQNIYKKLGATDRAEAVKLAQSAGLLAPSVTEGTTRSARPPQRENARPNISTKPA
jgi:DNA-binding CsgD family transcriptional regulator